MSLRTGNFTVSLKIGGQEVQLTINSSESLDDVFQKLTNSYPQCSSNKAAIMEKLTNNLREQIHNQTLTQRLNESISNFLAKNSQDKKKSTSKHNLSVYSNASQSKNGRASQKEESVLKENEDKKKQPIIHYNKREVRVKPQANGKSFIRSSEKKRNCNPDLIKACQIIMKKTQNTDMKQMAREFLKEKGYLKNEKDNHKKHLISQLSNVYYVEQSREQEQASSIANQVQKIEQSIQTSKIVPKTKEKNIKSNDRTRRENSRSSKYKYLQSSMNESLNNNYEHSQISNVSEFRPKRYSYLQF